MTQIGEQTQDALRTRKVELVLQQLDSLPTLPAIAVRLLSLTGSADTKIEEVTQLLAGDPSLTGKLLSLVQSAACGARVPVTNIRQAVVMLGFEALRNLVLSVKVFEVFSKPNDQDGDEPSAFNRGEFWKHSLAVATAAEMIAGKLKGKLSAQDAFVCGLLHDIGKVAFDTVMPKSFSRVAEVATLTRGDIAEVEKRIIGLDHAIAGKRLAQAWNLPTMIVQAIWLHGAGPTAIMQGVTDPAIVHVIALADLIARRQHIGYSGNFLFPYDIGLYQGQLGLSDGDIAAVTGSLAEELEKRARAIGLYDVDSKTLYLEAIAQANGELARVNQQLSTQNRRLHSRSACFELVTKLYQRIVPAASPAQLLAEIGRVSHEFLGATQLVLFSQDPDQKVGEVLTFDSASQTHDSFLMQMPPVAGDQRQGRSGGEPIRPATPQLDWLMDRVGPFLNSRNCAYLPLLCGSDPVGGIVWARGEGSTVYSAGGDLLMVSQAWGMTLRTAQVREQQNVLAESLAASNRELGLLQQQLVRAKSLSSVGEMAAGAAHEMNNPLAVMCGRAQLLASKLTDGTLKQDAVSIAQQGQRLSQIITDLMEFAKPEHPKLGQASAAELVAEGVQAAKARAAGAGVKVRVECSPDLPVMHVDARQISNAIAEVVLNAMQATQAAKGSGAAEVLVQTRLDSLDRQVIIQVTDHGTGMSDQTIRHVFSPFYSAKTAGRSRG
ncbi:MAG: HDOD domain-containing protein, partial [Planctomycetia bacterium]|nr:HDOD domain-containing protein [Planctomycetia bacterium]